MILKPDSKLENSHDKGKTESEWTPELHVESTFRCYGIRIWRDGVDFSALVEVLSWAV
jgi:hypothetical protein